ncbi:MAG: phage tail family protein [Oscillospiraceae bacterium]|nr:phage tail family protein [Oscillospiraceae bacterium]
MAELTFNGHDLPAGVHVTTLTINSPSVDVESVTTLARIGEIFTRRHLGPRVVEIMVTLDGTTIAERMQTINALNAWAYSEEPAKLTQMGVTGAHLLAVCTQYVNTDQVNFADEFKLKFRCLRPEWISDAEETAELGSFTILGSLPTPIRIEQTLESAVSSPVWTFDAGAYTILIDGDVAAGALVIDTETGRVTLDGQDIGDQVTLMSSPVFALSPGAHTALGGSGAGGTIYYSRRWL